jgi:predicted nucleic acid-binding protein
VALLIDSSVYIDWMRKRREFIPEILRLQPANPVLICGIIEAEVARGILAAKQRDRFLEFTRLLERIETDTQLWTETSLLAWNLDRKGMTLPLTDIAIAACAKKTGAVLVTLDSDFQKIPGLKTLSRLPV